MPRTGVQLGDCPALPPISVEDATMAYSDELDLQKLRIHGGYALHNEHITTLCGALEAFRASARLMQRMPSEGVIILRDFVKEQADLLKGPERDLRLAFAKYLNHLAAQARTREARERHLLPPATAPDDYGLD